MSNNVLVIIGAGGMGEAVARRLGSGRTVVIADVNDMTLARVKADLEADGFHTIAQMVDVSSRESLRRLAQTAAAAGDVMQVVHTAGLSPVQASIDAILRVDLLGVALMLEEFGTIVAPHGAGVVIASMAGHMPVSLTAADEQVLMHAACDTLLDQPFLHPEVLQNSGAAYSTAKRANALRVMAASLTWGQRGARINTISPGIIATPMGQQELAGPSGDMIRALTAASAIHRVGTPNDIAEAAVFLLGDSASFITGADLLVDGGVIAALQCGALSAKS